MLKYKYILVFFVLQHSALAWADLLVDESIVIYEHPSQSIYDVTVYNSDETANLFLEVSPFEVARPGFETQELIPLSLNDSTDFLVSPNRAIIPPNSASLVRLLNLKNSGDSERVYRINLVPASPPAELAGDEDAVASLLQVIVAYQVLVIILPEEPRSEVEFDRSGNTLSFSNPGNANYLLADGVQCDPMEPANCVYLQSRRIYPGNSWSIELPFDGPAQYSVRNHEGRFDLEL